MQVQHYFNWECRLTVIHPDTELRYINDEIGFGVFATAPIPHGTIIYIKDELEVIIDAKNPLLDIPIISDNINKYSYIESSGSHVISWDIAKFVNHSCAFNTLSTGYGFEIAIRDIEVDEQITDDYGLFNIEKEMTCCCGSANCRGVITADDVDLYFKKWDKQLQLALKYIRFVPQPLMDLADERTMWELDQYLSNRKLYKSVYELKYQSNVSDVSSNVV